MKLQEALALRLLCWMTVKGLQVSEALQRSGETLTVLGRQLEGAIRGRVMEAIIQQQAEGEKNKP